MKFLLFLSKFVSKIQANSKRSPKQNFPKPELKINIISMIEEKENKVHSHNSCGLLPHKDDNKKIANKSSREYKNILKIDLEKENITQIVEQNSKKFRVRSNKIYFNFLEKNKNALENVDETNFKKIEKRPQRDEKENKWIQTADITSSRLIN